MTRSLLHGLLCTVALCAATPLHADHPAALTDPDSREAAYRELVSEVAHLQRQGQVLKKVVKLATPSVVHLVSYKQDTSSGTPLASSTVEEAGAGVLIRLDGRFFVLTNRHVIADAPIKEIKIRSFDRRFLTPERLWTDPESDVAVIRVVEEDLIAARLGDSDELEIGDFVLAFGSPFGLSHSVSFGIISAKGRRDLELGSESLRLQDFLQTDAAVNPGNSGGPLLNLRGQVIGINTAIATNSGGNEGVSFAIPINLVMFVAEQLITNGQVNHAYLGVQLAGDFDLRKASQLGLARVRGALVKGITPRSPAFFANLQPNDVVVQFNGVSVEDDDHLVNLVSVTPIGESVELEIIRQGKPISLQVTVGNRRHFETSP